MRPLVFCLVGLLASEAHADIERIRSLMATQADDEAYTLLCTAFEQRGNEPEVFLFKGVLERKRGDLRAAANSFERGTRFFPLHPDLRVELAVTYSWQGRLKDARQAYSAALGESPKHRGARLGLARVLVWSEDFGEAKSVVTEMLREDPNDIDALNLLALIHRSQLELRRARRVYQRILRQNPEHAEAKEGLQLAKRYKRSLIGIEMGLIGEGDRTMTVYGVRGSHELSERWTLAANYRSWAPQASDPNQLSNHTAAINSVWRLGRRNWLSAEGIAQTSDTDRSLLGGLGFSRKLDVASIRFGARAGGGAQGPIAVGYLGAERPVLGFGIGATLFVSKEPTVGRGFALASQVQRQLALKVRAQVGWAVSTNQMQSVTHSATVAMSRKLTRHFDTKLSIAVIRGQRNQNQGTFSVDYRF